MNSRTAQILCGIGRTFITAGLLVLAFAVFQLWGTGLQEERAQGELFDEFDTQLAFVQELAAQSAVVEEPQTTVPPQDLQPDDEPPPGSQQPPITIAPELAAAMTPTAGDAMGRIEIPKLELTKVIVQGVRRSDLRDAPGHYPDTVFPGQAGNAAIAGHRTTYGAPFGDLDLLDPGDSIVVETLQGKFYYEVIPQIDPATGGEIGYQVVTPYDIDVLEDKGDNRLTLTACHPKYSARQRIVVSAKLVSEPANLLPGLAPTERPIDESPDGLGFDEDPSTVEAAPSTELNGFDSDEETADGELTAEDFESSLGWQMEEMPTVALSALAVLLIGLAGYVSARKWKRIPAYAAASVPFLAMLWVCFEHLDRLLPAY